eukprot:NODE_263_length_11363_cov_0.749556.p1 type:complete len:1626 gc:universal NODE_263_length_11363_cov_0.749556:923-5800(+)
MTSSSKSVMLKPQGPLQPANPAEIEDPKKLQWICCLKVQIRQFKTNIYELPDLQLARRQMMKILKIKSQDIRRMAFIHKNRYLEVICTAKVLERVLEYVRESLGGTPFSMGSWLKFIKLPINKSLYKEEYVRLKSDIYEVALSIHSPSRFENDVTKLLGYLCHQLNANFHYNTYIRTVKSNIEEAKKKKIDLPTSTPTSAPIAIDDELNALMADLNNCSTSSSDDSLYVTMDDANQSCNVKKRKIDEMDTILCCFTVDGTIETKTFPKGLVIGQICDSVEFEHVVMNLQAISDWQTPVIDGSSILCTKENLAHKIEIDVLGIKSNLFVPFDTLASHLVPPMYCNEKFCVSIDGLGLDDSGMLLDNLKSIFISSVNEIATYLPSPGNDKYARNAHELKTDRDFDFLKLPKIAVIFFKNVNCMIWLFLMSQIMPIMAFHIHFGGKIINIDAPINIAQDIAIQMCARGIAAGKVIFEGKTLPMGHQITSDHSGRVYYKLNEMRDLRVQEVISTKNTKLRVLGWNVCGLKYNTHDILAIIQAFDLDVVFLSECKISQNTHLPSNFILFNNSNTCYGCAVVYNSLKYSRGDLNISGSEYHLLLKLESIDLLYVYRRLSTNCIDWYHSIRHMISNKVFMFGDVNVNKLKALNTQQISMFDYMAMDGLYEYDLGGDYSFLKNGNISYPDLAFYKGQTSYKVIEGYLMQRFDISDHCGMIFEFELEDENVVIYPKMPRWNVHKLKDEDTDFRFKHEEDLEIIREEGVLEQHLLEFENDNLPGSHRYAACTHIGDVLIRILHSSANRSIGKSRLFHGIDTQMLQDSTTARLRGNHAIANSIIDQARKLAQKKFKSDIDKLESCQFLKVINLVSRRKGVSRQHLDRLRLEQHFEKWDDKWHLNSNQHGAFIPTNFNNFTWIDYNMEDLEKIISKLPSHKAAGPTDVPNELLKHSSARFKSILLKYFNLIGRTGIVPDIFRFSSILPVHKGRSDDYESMVEYRPIGLCCCLRKMFEKMLKPLLMPFLKTSENQFGFKCATTLLDAAWYFESILDDLNYNPQDYILIKGDLSAAFDSCSHESLLNMCQSTGMPDNITSLIQNLNMRQNIKLSLGDRSTNYKSINQGIIQGTIISPNLFTKLVDWAMTNIDAHCVWFADDLLILMKRSEMDAKMTEIIAALGNIGLHFNMNKTHEVTEVFEKWLGLQLNHLGTNSEQQINANLKKARNRIRNARNCGIFSGGYKQEHLLRYVGSAILPLLEFGIGIHEPILELASKVDVFLNTVVRDLLGIPKHTPVIDIRTLSGYTSFFDRWTAVKVKFTNKVNVLNNDTDDLEYQPMAKMSFSLNKKLKSFFKEKDKSHILQVCKRSYPNRDTRCSHCMGEHKYVNGIFKCHSNLISQPTEKCEKFEGVTYLSFPNSWQSVIQQQQTKLNSNQLLVYTDASLHLDPEIQATGAAIAMSQSHLHVKSYDLLNLQPDNSTRCELATVVCILKDIQQISSYNTHEITIYTDSKSTIDILEAAKDNTIPLYKLYGCDLIKHVLNTLDRVSLVYTPGHDDSNPHSLNHLCDYLSHSHDIASPAPIELTVDPDWVKYDRKMKAERAKEINLFRLNHLMSTEMNKNVLYEVLRELHINCIPTT